MIRNGNIAIDRKSHTIWHGPLHRTWRGLDHPTNKKFVTFQLIEHMLLSLGATPTELFDRCYGDDADGGPEMGLKQISVFLNHLEVDLRALNLKLHKCKVAGEMRYWVRV